MCTQSRGIGAEIVERFHRTLLNEFYRVAFQPGRSSQRATVRNLLPNSDVKSATISLAAFHCGIFAALGAFSRWFRNLDLCGNSSSHVFQILLESCARRRDRVGYSGHSEPVPIVRYGRATKYGTRVRIQGLIATIAGGWCQ
jgi:hypothetical protein